MTLDNDRLIRHLKTDTYGKLKDYTRFNGLKFCLVLDTLADLLIQDEELGKKVASLALDKEHTTLSRQ